MIWNLTQNVCFLELWRKMWRLDVMPNNHGRGRTAFKHFPCIRLLKWHSFAGCWHLSRGILQTHGITCYVHPWFKHWVFFRSRKNRHFWICVGHVERVRKKVGYMAIKSLSRWDYVTGDNCKLTCKNEKKARYKFSQTHIKKKVTQIHMKSCSDWAPLSIDSSLLWVML